MLPPRAYVFIGLNGVRILSIIALLLVFSSSIVAMVHDVEAVNRFILAGKTGSADNTTAIAVDSDYIEGSSVPNQPAGAFWAVLNRLLIIGQVVVLLLSEFGWPASFFDRYFPVLGKDFGTGALGVIECLIGAAILSHHVDFFNLFAAFFLFAIGCLNIAVGLVWRERAKAKRSLTSWREQAKGVLPTNVAGVGVRPMMDSPPSFVAGMFGGDEKGAARANSLGSTSKAGFGFGRQGEKAAGLKGFLISKPLESLPRYMAGPNHTGSTDATVV